MFIPFNTMFITFSDTTTIINILLGLYIATILTFGLYGLYYGFSYGYSIRSYRNRTIIDLIRTTLAYGFLGVWTAVILPFYTLYDILYN